MAEQNLCKTGLGRIVWGHPLKAQQKRDDNKQPVFKDGQPVLQWSFGVAFPKAEFQQLVWPTMAAVAQAMFPNGFPSNFAWKYVDGDGFDGEGKPYSAKEGYAGCIVLAISTMLGAPPVYKYDPQSGNYIQQNEDGIKTGDYVAVSLNIQPNVAKQRTHKSGLYINPVAVELVAYGQAIINTPDPRTLFGGQQYQLPPGASQQPVSSAPAGAGMPGTGMQQQPGQMGGMQMGGMGGMPQQQQMQPMGGVGGTGQPSNMQMGMQQQPGMMQGQPQQQQMQPGQMGGMQQAAQMGGGMPQNQQMQQAQPAYDYIQNTTGQQFPPQQPQMQMGMQQQPGMMQGQPQQQQMQPGQMGGMPGMMPGN